MAFLPLNKTKGERFSVKWEINNVREIDDNRIESSRFTCPSGKHVFRLFLWPVGERKEDQDYVSLFLGYEIRYSKEDKVAAKYAVTVYDANNVKCYSTNIGFHTFSVETFLNYGMYRFMKRSDFLAINQGKSSNRLTIQVEIEEADGLITDVIKDRTVEYTTYCNLIGLFDTKLLSDITLKVGQKCIHAHKIILVSASQVFLDTFTQQSDLSSLELNDFEEEVVYKGIEFIYSSTLTNFEEIALDLLRFAHRYKIRGLHVFLEDFLIRHLSINNVIDYISVAHQAEAATLKSLCTQLICKESKVLSTSKGLQELDSIVAKELFEAIVRSQ